MLLKKEIESLISLHQEGPYWDFKRQWYTNGHEANLLHDIICMANNLANRDAFIILGVDEENGFALRDISQDPARRNTQNMVTFLRDKQFAGEFRPTVTVQELMIRGTLIDVLCIQNSFNTPFYIKKDFHQVRANFIYTRVQDTNTPVDKSADLHHVEQLWKKRFGLTLTPLERMHIYLSQKQNWESCPGYDELKYYRYAPEFTIGYPAEDPEGRNGYEYYILNQTDSQPHWTIIYLKYHQTVLKALSGIMLDGGRHFSPCPNIDGFSVSGYGSWDVNYRYWTKDSLEYSIHQFYFDSNNMEAVWSEQRLMENILLFEDENEHQEFNWYAENHWCLRDSYLNNIQDPYLEDTPTHRFSVYAKQIIDVQILQLMLSEYRKANKT